jgi:hypothetical protein
MKNLQKAGGISSLISAATTLFAMGLVLSVLSPVTNPAWFRGISVFS